jgi:hypothetical protein
MLDKLKARYDQIKEETAAMSEQAAKLLHNTHLTEEQRNRRFEICKACEWLYTPTTTCKKCGCFMVAKTYLQSAECPIGKWTTESRDTSKD